MQRVSIIMKITLSILLVTLYLLSGCTMPLREDAPTIGNGYIEKLSGQWKLENAVVDLCLDETFSIVGASLHEGSGTWSISRGSKKEIRLRYDDDYTRIIGYVINDPENDGLSIYGGSTADPETWDYLERVASECGIGN